MIAVIDDFIPARYQDELENVFCSDHFLWSYQECTYKPYKGVDERIKDVPFLGRKLYGQNSQQAQEFDFVRPMIYFFIEHTGMDVIDLGRVKANLMMPRNDDRWHPPHTDAVALDHHTLLYYVNDNDGDTILFNDNEYTIDRRITPKKGRAVIFPSNMLHCGTNPTTRKVAINFVLRTK